MKTSKCCEKRGNGLKRTRREIKARMPSLAALQAALGWSPSFGEAAKGFEEDSQ